MPKSGKGSCIDGCPKFPKNSSKKSGMSLDFDKLRRRKRKTADGEYTPPSKMPPAEQKETPNVQVADNAKVYGTAKAGSPELEALLKKRKADQEARAAAGGKY